MAYQSALQAIARQKAAGKMPATPKPRDMNDPYDPELAASSAALYPTTFRPPAIGDPKFRDYFNYIFSPDKTKIQDIATNIENASFQKNAPSYSKILLSIKGQPANLDEYIVDQLDKSIPLGTIKQNLASGTVKTPTGELITGLLAPADYNALVSTYANELDKATSAVGTVYKDYLTSTVNTSPAAKNYLAGLPDTNLKYGITENLGAGFISWKTHPEVDKALKNPKVAQAGVVAKTAPAGYMSDPNNRQGSIDSFNKMRNDAFANSEEGLFKEFNTSKANPYRDEAIRRQGLKKKSYKP